MFDLFKKNCESTNTTYLILYQNNKIEFEYGNENEQIHLYSITKSFSAIAIFFAIQDKKLKIYDQICKYLPNDWSNLNNKFNNIYSIIKEEKITLFELLTHTTGLERKTEENIFKIWNFEDIKYNKEGDKFWELNYDKSKRKQYFYNNVTPDIIPYVINEIYKEDIDTFLKKKLFKNIDFEWKKNEDGICYGAVGLIMSGKNLLQVLNKLINILEFKDFISSIQISSEKMMEHDQLNNIKNPHDDEKYSFLTFVKDNNILFQGRYGQKVIINFKNKTILLRLSKAIDIDINDRINNEQIIDSLKEKYSWPDIYYNPIVKSYFL